MTDAETTYAAIKDSIDGSLVQLGRGSGITDEHLARMVMVIAAPLAFIVEEAIADAREPLESRLEALQEAVREYLEEHPDWRDASRLRELSESRDEGGK